MSDRKKTKELLIAELKELRQRVAELEQAETNFRQAEELYGTLANSSPVGVYIFQNGKFRFVNYQFQKFSGYTEEELLSMHPVELVHREDRQQTRINAVDMLKGIRLTPYEFRIINKNGETRWAMESLSSICYQGERATLGNFMDITEKKWAEEALRSLAAQLSLTEEHERRIIATELHDHVSQSLAISNIKLGALLEQAPEGHFAKSIEEVRGLISQVIKETRSLTFSISSPLLYEFGLDAAIEQLAEEMREQYGIRFNFKVNTQLKPLSNDNRVLVFRLVKEIFTNILKHAKARHVDVSMKQYDGYLQITIEDDGSGFNVDQLNDNMKKNKGFGLFSIRERLRYIGGNMEIESHIGIGTKVTITTPVNQKSQVRTEG